MADTMTETEHDAPAHAVAIRTLLLVLAALLVLTWVTIAATRLELGSLNLWIALGIATAKATLVLLYFMHLRYDAPVNAIVFVAALLFLALFVGLALLDTTTYRPDLIPGYAPGIPSSSGSGITSITSRRHQPSQAIHHLTVAIFRG
jgi:cytochrome c oxidase subunit 4